MATDEKIHTVSEILHTKPAKPPRSPEDEEDDEYALRDLIDTSLGVSLILAAGAETLDLGTWRSLLPGVARALRAAAERFQGS